ncbi:MAG: 30S ribosome-binding factor RbfA [Bdellovibrionales bacterium]|nr:30S ribosome-binding factor RbfA [Bdellovibrionales bacterium]
MQENRRARLTQVIQEELSSIISRELKDPRVGPLTITAVELTPDAGLANIFISLLGGLIAERSEDPKSEIAMKSALEGLNSASGFLRRQLGPRLTVRHVPTLVFKADKGLSNAVRVYELLKKVNEPKPTDNSEDPT